MVQAPFKNKLSKKLLALFLVASLIPLISISIVVYQYTSQYVMAEAEKRLNKEAAILNALLLERLTFIKRIISDDTLLNLGRDTSSAYIISTKPNFVLPASSQFPTSIKNNNKLILTTDEEGKIYFVVYKALQDKYWGYELNTDYLFNGFSILSKAFDYCLQTNKEVLWCSANLEQEYKSLLNRIDTSKHSKGQLTLDSHSQTSDLQFVSRPLFLGGGILMNNWVAFASVPIQTVHEPVELFKMLFLFVLAMTLVTIGLVSFQQIKRLLSPLKSLMEGAENISQQNFSNPVVIQSGDEFEELGRTFNRMARKIEGSFDIMYSHSEIDRMILQTNDLDAIGNTAWLRTQRVIKSHLLLVSTSKSSDSSELSILSGGSQQANPQLHMVNIERSDVSFIDNSSTFTHEQFSHAGGVIAEALNSYEFAHLRVVPIILDGNWRGFVAQGFRGPVSSGDDNVLEGLADRLAVAMSNLSKQNKLYRMAHFDFLTQLPNRKLLRDRMRECIGSASQENENIAVVFADLDNFKQVNDSLGHAVGDQLLLNVSKRLTGFLGEGNTVAREGGDEFIILLPNIADREVVDKALNEILAIFNDPIQLEGHHIYISISLGVAIYPEHGTQVDKLLMNADTALYRSKSIQKGGFLFYEEGMSSDALKRLEIENALWESIENKQLTFHYQPLVNTHNNSIGFEALIRWNHPTNGPISPSVFIPIAEETGYMMEINRWMFDEIFSQIREWRKEKMSFDKVAINISPSQLLSPGFTTTFEEKLRSFEIPCNLIELEVTESVFLDNHEYAAQHLNELKQLGVSLSLDDFGTGYSSLSYLQSLPFDRLKIDRSFVSGIQSGDPAPALVTTIIDMAKNLNLLITAEGIEQDFQYAMLKNMGCQVLQGYYISKPIAAQECVSFVEKYRH